MSNVFLVDQHKETAEVNIVRFPLCRREVKGCDEAEIDTCLVTMTTLPQRDNRKGNPANTGDLLLICCLASLSLIVIVGGGGLLSTDIISHWILIVLVFGSERCGVKIYMQGLVNRSIVDSTEFSQCVAEKRLAKFVVNLPNLILVFSIWRRFLRGRQTCKSS